MLKRRLLIFSALAVVVFSFGVFSKSSNRDFDILIKSGKIVDGTGNPWFLGDIGITADTIVAIGDLSGKTAAKTIDAKGLVVSPGFIDIHTHCDSALTDPDVKANLNYLIQGTTTVVVGNCGGGTFKIAETKAKSEKQGIGTNTVMQVGHGNLRRAVMKGEIRASTPEELEKMKAILRQAMKEGAWGMSTGLEYIPGRYSNIEEVIELVKVVAEFGGTYNSHQRDEVACVPEATKETVRIGKETGVHVNVAHLKVSGKKNWGMMKEVVRVFNDARASGIYITADMYPYDKASPGTFLSRCFRVPKDMEPLAELDKKMRHRDLPDEEREKLRKQYFDELLKALSDKSKREKIKKSTLVGVPHNWSFLRKGFPIDPSEVAMWGWDNYTILMSKKNPHLIGKIISDLAQEQKRDAFDIVVDLIIEEPDLYGGTMAMLEDEMKYAMKQDWLMFSSDGRAFPHKKKTARLTHPRAYGSQARVLRKYVREEKALTLENAIRKMTSLPASFLQMRDRGLLLRGYKADIVIFDPETIQDNATYSDPHQYSTGIECVIINGEISIENGEYDGALNGKVLLLSENK